jgi:hypothetical protein
MSDGSQDQDQQEEDQDQQEEELAYTTKTEREVAFKMIAAHALVDKTYYDWLRESPRDAVAYLHFVLDETDYRYLENVPLDGEPPGVQWDTVDEHIDQIRSALNAGSVVRSFW